MTDDLAVVLDYLGRSWVPPDVHEAMQRLRHAPRLTLGETGLGLGLVSSETGRYLDLGRCFFDDNIRPCPHHDLIR